MDNPSTIPLSSPKPPTSPATPDSSQTLPKTGLKLKYKPVFRPRKTAPTTEPAKISEAKTTLRTKSSADFSTPSSSSQVDTDLNKGTWYDYLYTKRERLTSAPRLRITSGSQPSVLSVTPQDSSDQKQCIKNYSRLKPEQVVTPTQERQVPEMPCPTKRTEDTPQGFGDEAPDTKEQLGRIAEISPERKTEATTVATGTKPTHQDSAIPIAPPKSQRTFEPKPRDAAAVFLPQFLAAWGVLNRAINEAIVTLHANPAAGPATPLMVLNSLGSTVIGAAIINAGIQPEEIKAAIGDMLLQYHHRQAKEAEDVAWMLGFEEGATVEEEADASMGDTTDDDSRVGSEGVEGMDEDLKIVLGDMEECAGDGEAFGMDRSFSDMEVTPANGGSTLGGSEMNGALAQDLKIQGSLEISDASMDESAGLIITTEDMDLGGQEAWTISQPAMSGQYTNPANVDITMSMEIPAEWDLLNSNITGSLSDREILEASMDLDVAEAYGVEPSNLHTDNSSDAGKIYSTTEDSKIETFCATGVSSDGEANEATFYFISNDVDSNRDQATANDTFFTKETAQCQSESSVEHIDSLCDTEEANGPYNFDITEDYSSIAVIGSIKQDEVTTTPCTIKESADHEDYPEVKGFGCGKPTDSVEEHDRVTSTHETEEVRNCRKIGGMDEFNDINDMSASGKLECIDGFDGSKQVDVLESPGTMEPNNLEHQRDAEAAFITSSETKTSNESSHLDNMTNASRIKHLDDGIRMEAIPPPASINDVDIFESLRSTEDIGSSQNLGDTVETSSTSSLCIIERVGSIKDLNSNGDPDSTMAAAGDPDATDKISEEILHREDKVGDFGSTAEANEFMDLEEKGTRQGLDTASLGKFDLAACGWRSGKQSRSLSEERRASRQDTSKNNHEVEQIQQPSAYTESEEDEDEGWANETLPCPTERRIWNWLAGLPEQSEVEEEIKMMEEMRKKEEARNHEKLTLMLESVEKRQKSWEGVFLPRSNQQIAPTIKTIPTLVVQVTAAPEVATIPTVIVKPRVWPSVLLSIWVSFMFLVGSWGALLDLFRLCSPNTRLPDAPFSSTLLRLTNFGLDVFYEISDSLGDVDLQQLLFLFTLVLWVFSRWGSGETLGTGVARLIGEIVRLAWRIFSLGIMVLMIIYTTAMDWIRYLTLAHDGSTISNQKVPYDIELGHSGREVIILEEWNSSLGLEFEIGMDTYLWVGRTIEEAGVGESLVTLTQADIAMATPSLLAEQVCQRYTLGVGAGKAVVDGSSGILYSSLGLCLASFVVWGRGNRRQLRWRRGRS